MRINLARLNHIFIPATKEGRDRIRQRLLVRSLRPLIWLYFALSEEGRFLAITSVLVGMIGVEIQSTSIYLLWCVMIAPLLVSLACRAPFSLLGRVQLDFRAPRRIAVGEELRVVLLLSSTGDRAFDAIRVRGPMLPWDGVYTCPPPRDLPLDRGATCSVSLGIRFSERGEHHLDPFSAAALVPFGLALGRSVESPSCRVMVVPKIANIRKIHIPRAERYQPGGVAMASKTGESMDLLGVRPYRLGDPVRDLHARTSARRGFPHVREYQQEYFSRFGVILDTHRGETPEVFEAAISLAAGVVAHLSRGEGLIDLLVCGGQLHPLTLGRSLGQLEQALDLLACVHPGGRLDLEELLRGLSPFLERLSCIFLLWTTLDQPRLVFQDQLHRRLPCRALLVQPGEHPGSGSFAPVIADAVLRGEPLAL
ncbi:MAG: DUF58 domain-containing protein [Myxococcales bacterium]|nr:DUF58 domain-containing protein [Polyangiaceae bacterium]MDW8250948.1 DUF58 domain-containing protein [Myxococcales bacterium]